MNENSNKRKNIGLRLLHDDFEAKINELSKKYNLSINATVNLLIGYALDEMEKSDKEFEVKTIFVSK